MENILIKKYEIGGNIQIGKGGGGDCDCRLKEDLLVSNPLGKYDLNDIISKGETFESIFRGILSKTYVPTLTGPSASIYYLAPALNKVGSNIMAKDAMINFNRGRINPQYTSESQYRSGDAYEYTIRVSGSTNDFIDTNSTGVFSIPSFTKNTAGKVEIKATVGYESGCQPKDSDGNDYDSPLPSGHISSPTMIIEFINPFYWGVSVSDTINDLSNLIEDLSVKGNKIYKYTTNDQYVVFVYDKSYGELSSILDQNDFETIDGWHISEVIVDGQTYKVYASEYKTTDTNAKYTFIF